MRRIVGVVAVPVMGGYYYEDLAALQAGPMPLAERYTAAPVTPGFRHVREPAEAVSVGLALDDGRVAWGDCVSVAYGGKAGRDSVFRSADGLATLQQVVAPLLDGRELTGFRELAAEVDALTETVEVVRPVPQPAGPDPTADAGGLSRRDLLAAPARWWRSFQGEGEQERPVRPEGAGVPVERVREERRLHAALRYGVSQALLAAVALARGVTMAEVVAEEWGLPRPDAPVPIHAQSGGERHHNADKMIVRRLASLPHGLIDDIPEQLGADGAKLVQYARWLKERIRELGGPDYQPTIHLDLHGGLGQIFHNDLGRVLGQLYALETAVKPYALRVESPVILDSRAAQIEAFKTLRDYARFRKLSLQLVADEWANTLEDIQAFVDAQAAHVVQIKMPDLGSVHNTVDAVLACRTGGVGAFLGGSCAETDLSARVAVHVALATRPELIMARPGMGVDEGVMLVHNEMARTLALIQ